MVDYKQICCYGSTCYRRNPVHFREMEHPHLDKLLDDNLEDMPIQLPNTLDFVCNNRSLLMQQLEILRKVKREKSTKREILVAIIDLTNEDESPSSSQSQDENNTAEAQSKTENHEYTQSRIENYEHTQHTVENYQTTQRRVENYHNTQCRVENYKNTQHTVENYETTQRRVENYKSTQYKVETYENTQCRMESPSSEREEMLRMMRARGEAPEYVAKSGKFVEKLKRAAPYYIFYTAVQKEKLTWRQKLSITMPELLDKSLGKINKSLHLNFVINIRWLLCQYKLAEQTTDMQIFFSRWDGNHEEQALPANVKIQQIKLSNVHSVHHSKISILEYEDGGIRIIVSSANLYREDWELRTQGLWISPHLPLLPNSVSYLPTYGESRTGFKRDFLEYLSTYNSEINQWRAIVRKCDFSAVTVAFVSSVPGDYPIKIRKELGIGNSQLWGHRRLAKILENHVEIPHGESRSMIIAQASSIGSLGSTYNTWIGSELVDSMSKSCSQGYTQIDFQLIFPSIENYNESYDMLNKSTCLSYTKIEHLKQQWITRYLRKWKASCSGRTKAMPHIKTYTRVSADEKKIWWFVLGSANLSKAAWGWRQGSDYRINNYEAGVVFLPKFLTGAKSFPIKSEPGNTTPNFPIPYDLPLTRYHPTDDPYFTEFFETCHGKL